MFCPLLSPSTYNSTSTSSSVGSSLIVLFRLIDWIMDELLWKYLHRQWHQQHYTLCVYWLQLALSWRRARNLWIKKEKNLREKSQKKFCIERHWHTSNVGAAVQKVFFLLFNKRTKKPQSNAEKTLKIYYTMLV